MLFSNNLQGFTLVINVLFAQYGVLLNAPLMGCLSLIKATTPLQQRLVDNGVQNC